MLAAALLATALPVAADNAALEYRVRAAFLFNFVKFVSWPPARFASEVSPINLCVPEGHPIAAELELVVQDKVLAGRALRVLRLPLGANWGGCHLAYLGAAPLAQLGGLLPALAGQAVLTVHEASRALPGGVIRLYLDERRMRFEINTATTARSPLLLSAKLLAVATLARDDEGTGP